MTDTLDSLALRVDRLERELGKWKIAVAASGIALAVLTVVAILFASGGSKLSMGTVDRVAARKFVLVNKANKPIATFGTWGEGAFTGLLLMPNRPLPAASRERERLAREVLQPLYQTGGSAFFATSEGGSIVLGGTQEKKQTDFAASLWGGRDGAGLDLSGSPDSTGKAPKISLRTPLLRTEAWLSLRSREGRTVTFDASDPSRTGKSDHGFAVITLSEPIGPAGKVPREAQLELKSNGPANLRFTAENFRMQMELAVDSDGSPHLDLYDNDGKLRAAFGSATLKIPHTGDTRKTAASSVILFDKKGNTIWRSPQ